MRTTLGQEFRMPASESCSLSLAGVILFMLAHAIGCPGLVCIDSCCSALLLLTRDEGA